MPVKEALKAATLVNATLLGMEDELGQIKEGFEDFIPAAVEAGAVAVVARPEARVSGAVHIADPEPRRAFAHLAAAFFTPVPGHIVAVTGTNGKTSCVEMTRQIWRMHAPTATAAMIANIFLIGIDTDVLSLIFIF